MPNIETWTGEERAYGGTAKMFLMLVPEMGSPDREAAISVAAKKKQVSSIRATRYEAYPGKIDDFGAWWNNVYHVREGMVFRVKGHRSSGHGARAAIASIYIQIRENAAYHRIEFDGTNGAGRARATYFIEGRFDILTTAQVEEVAGPIPHWVRPEIVPRAVEATFRVVTVSEQITKRPEMSVAQVVNSDGELRQIVLPARRRRINI